MISHFRKFLQKRQRRIIREKTVREMDKVVAVLTEDIASLEKAIGIMNQKFNTTELPLIANNFLFFRVNFKDISVLSKQLLLETRTNERNLIVRSLALHLYEFLDDTKDFLGKKMKEDLESLPNNEFLLKELFKLKEYYYSIKSNIFSQLGDIRHNTIAHKSQNSFELNKAIKGIDEDNVEVSCMLVWVLFGLIITFQKSILNYIHAHQPQNDCEISDQQSSNSLQEKTLLSTVEAKFKEFVFLLQGMTAKEAEFYSKLTPETIEKMKELAHYLEKERENKSN